MLADDIKCLLVLILSIWDLSSEPTSVDLHVDGVTDICTKEEDINFVFTGFSVSGTVSGSDSHSAEFCKMWQFVYLEVNFFCKGTVY